MKIRFKNAAYNIVFEGENLSDCLAQIEALFGLEEAINNNNISLEEDEQQVPVYPICKEYWCPCKTYDWYWEPYQVFCKDNVVFTDDSTTTTDFVGNSSTDPFSTIEVNQDFIDTVTSNSTRISGNSQLHIMFKP
jgi:hypothetical protein